MNSDKAFQTDDIKPLRKFYNVLWFIILAIAAIMLSLFYGKDPTLIKPESEYLKTFLILILLFTVPGVFSWYTKRLKKIKESDKNQQLEVYKKIWKIRALVVTVVFIFNTIGYFLVMDKSLMFMLAIAAFVFLYCRPSLNTLYNELTGQPKEET